MQEVSLFEIPEETLKDLRPNKFKLDTECESNGNLYHYYSDQLVDAEYERDLLKAKIKEVESKIELQIRAEKANPDIPKGESIIPVEYQDVKLTEAVVSALVNCNVDVCETRQKLILSERKVGKLDAVVKAFAQRKGELDNLVNLYNGNYFSAPDTSKKNVNDDYSKQQNKRLNERSKKKNGSKDE